MFWIPRGLLKRFYTAPASSQFSGVIVALLYAITQKPREASVFVVGGRPNQLGALQDGQNPPHYCRWRLQTTRAGAGRVGAMTRSTHWAMLKFTFCPILQLRNGVVSALEGVLHFTDDFGALCGRDVGTV